jgi:hypothetical protein
MRSMWQSFGIVVAILGLAASGVADALSIPSGA